MIAVIADDFTGAAEIGGIGLRRGMRVQIETTIEGAENTDLLVIATDTRSLPGDLAKKEISKITQQLIALKPDFIFKKLDSVLRGNIYEELIAQIDSSTRKKALVIAGNPHFNRVISNGVYYVDDIPLEKTSFANDPEFPRETSNVKAIVGEDKPEVVSLNVSQDLPTDGIIIGDVKDEEEMLQWTHKIDNQTIAAGGSGFFDVLLREKWPNYQEKEPVTYVLGKKSLFIFGSTFPKNAEVMEKFRKENVRIMNMPEEIYLNKDFESNLLINWVKEIVGQLQDKNKVVVTINHQDSDEELLPVRIRENVGLLVSKVLQQVTIDDLLIEGGATTSMILKYLDIRRLFPFRELDFGVIQMKVDQFPNLIVTTKPGSYSWPDSVLLSKTNKKSKI
ncbi:MAG TPA: four-carbon acid sugar kinase family protein [Sunxiuqinia sp.]|nr:four-carbon acid sugar kinase family protein [Sunxiuqinia sp.]